MNETLSQYSSLTEGRNSIQIVAVVIAILAIYFLPTVLAAFSNRKHLVKIAELNVPEDIFYFCLAGLECLGLNV